MKIKSTIYKSLVFLSALSFVFAQDGGKKNNNNKILVDDASKYTDVGNIRMTVTNFGVFGSGFANWEKQPSCEYPRGSKIEHLYIGGLWVGGLKEINGEKLKLVSTAAVDVSSVKYGAGAEGFEFTTSPESKLISRSSLPLDPFYSPKSVSHRDYVSDFTDTNLIVPIVNTPISNHVNPLGISVHCESYSWNYAFADFFVILNYTLKNVSSTPIDSLHLGIYTDLVVRNLNITPPRGSTFFSAGATGFSKEDKLIYQYDVVGDNGLADSYGAIKFLGSNPIADSVFFNVWQFRNSQGDAWTLSPASDADKYDRLSSSFMNQISLKDAALLLKNPSNRIQLISVGPYRRLNPGDSINFAFAVVCAKKPGEPKMDNDTTRENLMSNVSWAQRTYNGTDRNGNGKLDPDEPDINGDGSIIRYILPTPPAAPNYRFDINDGRVTLYWTNNSENSVDLLTNRKHFEGYRLYRTKPLEKAVSDSLFNFVAQFDKEGDGVGLDNGFSLIAIKDQDGSPIYKQFDGDTNKYVYKYEFENLLNGWEYCFSLSAFSTEDKVNGVPSLESSLIQNQECIVPGSKPVNLDTIDEIGIFPNPYYAKAGWDANVNMERGRKLYFYNLPKNAQIEIFNVAGDKIAEFEHIAGKSEGANIDWFNQTGNIDVDKIKFSGGIHAWDLISAKDQALASGLYIVYVKDKENGSTKTGRFLIVK